MFKKGIGIVGYGGFGAFLHKAWNEMPNAEVKAVCDSNPQHLPVDTACYEEYTQLLADPNIEIVSIATPPSSHKQLALQAFAAGKHVLIEKPLALNPDDASQIAEAAAQANVKAGVNFVLRYNPVIAVLARIVKQNVLGKLRRIDLRNYAMQETVPKGHWFWDTQTSGGILLEHGVHFFDLAAYISQGNAVDCWSTGMQREEGMEDRVLAVVKYDNGVVGSFWHSFSRPRELERTSFHFAFDLGEIDVFGWIPLEMKIWGWTDRTGMNKLRELDVCMSAVCLPNKSALASEFEYPVDYEISGDFSTFQPKLEQYADGLRLIMNDLIHSIDNPNYRMLVTMDNAVEAVRTAYCAAKAANP